MAANANAVGTLPTVSAAVNFAHGHARKSGEEDHGLGNAVGKAARQDDRPGTAPVEQALHPVQ